MRMALYVISKAGFGISLPWPEENRKDGKWTGGQQERGDIPPGHSISFYDSTNIFLRNIAIVAIFGRRLLSL
jgi:hypothetical protein